jgi:hypothetical protein
MLDEVPLGNAVDTAWSDYRATHRDIDAADVRRCLLERHLPKKWEAQARDAEKLTFFGFAYLEHSPTRMLRRVDSLVCRLAADSARPDWTLLVVSYIISAAIVLLLQSIFGM